MKNTLQHLNNDLYEQLERINDDDLKGEELETQLKKTKTITKIAGTIIQNNKLILDGIKQLSEAGYTVSGKNAMESLGLKSLEQTNESLNIDFNKVTFKSKGV